MKINKYFHIIILAILLIILVFPSSSYAANISLNSNSAILAEVSTGRILYEKNSKKVMYPASTTKMMTAILVLENCNLDDIVTVSESALSNIPSGYVTCNLRVGEELTVEDLLYALMVPSANDAAYVLAEHVGGSVKEFADMMNKKAKELGCTDTNFVNPNGIHDENHHSTAYDLYLIAKYCMKNETFRKIVSTTNYTLPATNLYPENDRTMKTTNALINPDDKNHFYRYAVGIKTGHTSLAGNCIAAEASRDGLEFIVVTLESESSSGRFKDAIKLFDYAYDNFTITKINNKNDIIQTIEIENATKETKSLNILIDKEITVLNNKSIDMNSVIPEITLNEELQAPIVAGEKIGTIKYKVDDIEYTANLVAGSNVLEKPNYIFIFLMVAGFILLIFSIKLFNMPKKRKKSKKRR